MYTIYLSKSFPEVRVKGRDLNPDFKNPGGFVKLKTLEKIQDVSRYLNELKVSLQGEINLVNLKNPK